MQDERTIFDSMLPPLIINARWRQEEIGIRQPTLRHERVSSWFICFLSFSDHTLNSCKLQTWNCPTYRLEVFFRVFHPTWWFPCKDPTCKCRLLPVIALLYYCYTISHYSTYSTPSEWVSPSLQTVVTIILTCLMQKVLFSGAKSTAVIIVLTFMVQKVLDVITILNHLVQKVLL